MLLSSSRPSYAPTILRGTSGVPYIIDEKLLCVRKNWVILGKTFIGSKFAPYVCVQSTRNLHRSKIPGYMIIAVALYTTKACLDTI